MVDDKSADFGGHPVEYVASQPEDSLQEMADIVAEAGGKGIRIRTSLWLWNPVREMYGAWRGQTWKVTFGGIGDARAFGETMEALFDLLAMASVQEVRRALRAVLKGWKDAQAEDTEPPPPQMAGNTTVVKDLDIE